MDQASGAHRPVLRRTAYAAALFVAAAGSLVIEIVGARPGGLDRGPERRSVLPAGALRRHRPVPSNDYAPVDSLLRDVTGESE